MQTNFYKEKLSIYWRNVDKSILFSFLSLFILGLFFSFASTSFLAGERLDKDYYFFFSKHLIFVLVSVFAMILISVIDLKILNKLIIPCFVILLILLILVPIFGIEVKGAKRWLSLYFFRLQPIELIKPFFILMSAKILSVDNAKISNTSYFLSFLILSTLIVLLINQPDIGQSILLIGTWISIVFISGISIFYIFIFL